MKQSLTFYIASLLLFIMIGNIKCKSTKPPSPALLYNTPDSLIHKWECPSAGLKLNKPPGTTYTPTIAYETIGRIVLDTPRCNGSTVATALRGMPIDVIKRDSAIYKIHDLAIYYKSISDTPINGLKIYTNKESDNIVYSWGGGNFKVVKKYEVIVSSKSHHDFSARRDTTGKWEINNCEEALEIMYQQSKKINK